MRNIILLLCTFACSLGIAIAETPTQPEQQTIILIKRKPVSGPRSLTEVVAYAHVATNTVEVAFVAPMGEVTLYLTGESGVVDMAVVDSATENATLLLDDTASGNYTITLVDALGNEYSGAFSR